MNMGVLAGKYAANSTEFCSCTAKSGFMRGTDPHRTTALFGLDLRAEIGMTQRSFERDSVETSSTHS